MSDIPVPYPPRVKAEKHQYKAENDKAKLQAQIKYLREKRDSVLIKIQEVKNPGEEIYYDLKQGTEKVVNPLKDALSKAMAQLKKSMSNFLY